MLSFAPTSTIHLFRADASAPLILPFASQGISCGFPSPAEDYIEHALDLNQLLIQDKEATFFGRVKGNSMIDANIHNGDVVVIDRSMNPSNGCTALCLLDGEFTIKQLQIQDQSITLLPQNKRYKPVVVTPERDFAVWGVVTYVIHKIH